MRSVTTIALVVLVVSSGCVYLPQANTDATEPDAVTYPSGYSHETINSSTAKQTHISQGQAAESVTIRTTIDIFSPPTAGLLEANITASETRYVNDTTNRYYAIRNSSLQYLEVYQKPNSDWLYTYNPNETGERAYGSRAATENLTTNLNPRIDRYPVFALIERLDYSQSSVDRESGTITYTATAFTEKQNYDERLAPMTPRSAKNVTSTVIVDERGRLRSFNVTADIHSTCYSCESSYEYTVTLRASFSDYGETAVPRPDWLDEATSIIDD